MRRDQQCPARMSRDTCDNIPCSRLLVWQDKAAQSNELPSYSNQKENHSWFDRTILFRCHGVGLRSRLGFGLSFRCGRFH